MYMFTCRGGLKLVISDASEVEISTTRTMYVKDVIIGLP